MDAVLRRIGGCEHCLHHFEWLYGLPDNSTANDVLDLYKKLIDDYEIINLMAEGSY